MASFGYVKELRRWRVRWRATNRKTKKVMSGSKVFLEKYQAVEFYGEVEKEEKLWRFSDTVPGESIEEVISDFYRHIKRHTKRTQVHYRMVISKFTSTLNARRVQQLQPEHIMEYIYQVKDSGSINRTCNAHLTAIKAFCRYYSQRYKIANPASAVKMLKEEPPKPRFLRPDEYKKLISSAGQVARDRIVFLKNTGIRASEFQSLTPENIDLHNKTLTVYGKGRSKRTIPLNAEAIEVIPRLVPATRNALWLQLSRLSKSAGLEKLGPHSLRHLFATTLLLKGCPMIVVSKLLGHKSIRTTQSCYEHILSSDLACSTDLLVD